MICLRELRERCPVCIHGTSNRLRINGLIGAEEDNILQWLSATSFSKPQNTARETRTPGTGQWLLDLETYTDWRDSTPGTLWLHGAGKSTTKICCMSTNLSQLGAGKLYYGKRKFVKVIDS
jgi:hypothetical protein